MFCNLGSLTWVFRVFSYNTTIKHIRKSQKMEVETSKWETKEFFQRVPLLRRSQGSRSFSGYGILILTFSKSLSQEHRIE